MHLLLIKTVSEIFEKFYDCLSLSNVNILLECLEKSYRFAKEFNQEFGLRMKLWKEGFMADLKQLPRLTSQEKESISAYLLILFRMHFDPKEGLNHAENSKKLFDLCSKVLKDYCLQQSELNTINNSKREEGHQFEGDDEEEPDSDQEPSTTNLHEKEIERSLENLTPIVSVVILGNLLRLSDSDLKKHVKEITPLLIDLSLCNDYEIRVANKELLGKIFEYLLQKIN
mmetsp:Transcript_22235/g.16668  ORF Transcript_22235/g.16668 Transcript_22235/m.16668 type:complete len:228 (+) Transcript_22235:1960-2643(+)